MKKSFFLILLIFFLLLNKEVLSNEDVIIKKIAERLDFPVHLSKNEFISKNSIFVLEHKLGQILEIQNYNKNPKINKKPILNIKSLISESGSLEQGFTGFAFSPNFEEDKYIFVSYVNKKNQTILSRFKYDDKIRQAKLSSELELLGVERLSSEDTPYHNCGTISFNPRDNHLYICLGDTMVPESSQNIKVLNGKILRIDPFKIGENGKTYSFVRENPFTQLDGKPEILFIGFRNPWKFSFDLETGDIYIPDNGSEYIEELNIVKYENFNDYLNFGAGCFEGSYRIYDKHYSDVKNSKKICLKNINNPSMKMIEPKLQYFHESLISTYENSYGNSIIGGVVYKNKNSIWHNHYFFADYITSNIWYLDTSKKKSYIGINLYFGEYLGLTSINQVDDKLLATSDKGLIYEIILPNKKNLEKSIYNKPIIYNKLHAVDIMNRSNKIIFTTSSNFYKFLVKVRKIKEKLFGSN